MTRPTARKARRVGERATTSPRGRFAPGMEALLVPLAEIHTDPANIRRHDERNLRAIAASFQRFGQQKPIVIDRSGRIVAGNGTFSAIRTLGWTHIAAIRTDLADAELRAYAVADNRTAELATWNKAALATLLQDLRQQDRELFAAAGYSPDELDALLDQTGPPDLEGIDAEVGVRPAPTTRLGDVITLGRHRLLCGDATDADAVARLFQGRKATMVWTDPPYGVDYDPNITSDTAHRRVAGDADQGEELARRLLIPAFKLAARHTTERAAFYIWHASTTYPQFHHGIQAAGLRAIQTIIWVKQHHRMAWAHYHHAHEPCIYATKAGAMPEFHGGRDQTTIWRIAPAEASPNSALIGPGLVLENGDGGEIYITTRPPRQRSIRRVRIERPITLQADSAAADAWEVARGTKLLHPTQKPVELATRPIRNSTTRGELVYDPFAGSGTAILAAEATDRDAFACELDPTYCDLIVDRWEKWTQQRAQRPT